MEEELRKLKKELLINRICSIVVAVLLVCVLAGGAYALKGLAPAVTALDELRPLAEKMEDLDVDMINAKIAELDIDGLNQALEGLDTEELTRTLKNVNEASEQMKAFGESLSKLFGR